MFSELAQPEGDEVKRERLFVDGVVQGVGFRPFVYRLAQRQGLTGYVQNTPAGVVVEIEGASGPIAAFKTALMESKPAHSRIWKFDSTAITVQGGNDFMIRPSAVGEGVATMMLPDLAVCSDCLREMNDPADRRYRYPFINCTHCGPRFSIITALPYDRLNTTMAGFDLCQTCRCEYDNPDNRRHHAQPIACPECGPQLELRNKNGKAKAWRDKALKEAAQAVREGKILALKGLGGFHLICDARNREAVAKLRQRKRRPLKPFAVMYPSLKAAKDDCTIATKEEQLLTSVEAPIVLLPSSAASAVAGNVAPDNPNLGVMLPSTPLHHLLLSEFNFPVVATSGNRAGEPICTSEDEAVDTLKGIADVFLVHDRPISGRCDDSIVRVVRGHASMLRRSRGFAPLPIVVNHNFAAPVLAVGGHFKNTVALSVRDKVFLSPHIGELDSPAACLVHREAAERLCRLHQATPEHVVHDLHPDYRSTRMAREHNVSQVAVQHHYAHALACMADNGIKPLCLAVTWDGSGYGDDGSVWGGEFLRIVPGGYQRALHFLPFPLPGGDAAVLDPRRAALGMLYMLEGAAAFSRDIGLPESSAKLMESALKAGVNCPPTSSAGRIFDALAALTGICTENGFEGQAAMALEFAAGGATAAKDVVKKYGVYDFSIENGIIDWRPMLRAIIEEIEVGEKPETISAKLHATLGAIIVAGAESVGENTVLLTGGCFQNVLLLNCAVDALEQSGFTVHMHRQVPPNDGGLALGQIMAMAASAASNGL